MRIVLAVIQGPHEGREFVFDQHDNFIVGRAKYAHFQLSKKDKFFSRVHFMVEVNSPQCRLMDMGSTNGTLVNGQKVKTADLKDGDLIKAGQTVLRLSLLMQGSPSEAEVPVMSSLDSPGDIFTEPTLLPPSALVDRSAPTAPHVPLTPRRPSSRQPIAARGSCAGCSTILPEAVLSRVCPACIAKAREVPQPIGGYLLVRELGRGGMGVVYLALREADGLLLAVKTIQPAVAGTRTQIERFLREARILEQLDHAHVVSFRAVGESNGLLYFAMDYVPGIDASHLQKALGGPLPVARAVDLTCQMLEGLEYAHARGFVHREVKPANLLVENREGRDCARLSDFGLARTYQASQMSGLTIQGDVGGTMAFMAPEQITHFREAKPPADQYSAAASLYRLLTNKSVFDLPRESSEQIRMILQQIPVPILSRRPDLPPRLAEVIHRAVAREPSDRFHDVAEFRAALEPFHH